MRGDFLAILGLKSPLCISFSFSCSIKWFFYKDLGFILFFRVVAVLLRCLVCRHLMAKFGLSLTCYNVMLFVVLLRCFICVEAILKSKVDSEK